MSYKEQLNFLVKKIKESKEEFNPEELKMGTEIEKEHNPTIKFIKDTLKETGEFPSDKEIHQSISKDHLREIEDYYTRLAKMEEEAKQKKN